MCNKKRKRGCFGCYPKHFTDYFDLFAQPVYSFTFRDSYVVSTCVGSLCTIFLGLVLLVVLFAKVTVFLEQDPNTFTVTQGIEYAYYPEETEFDLHLISLGLTYRAEYQEFMSEEFTAALEQIVDIQMFTREKQDGEITTSEPLVLDPCSTLDLNNFYPARKSSESQFNYIQTYKPMQCLDESANLDLEPTRQQSSQVIGGVATNDRVKATRGGQDVKLRGDNYNRHDNWRELLFQVNPCVEDAAAGKTCIANAEEELAKMELVIIYNTQNFNKKDASTDPVTRDSVIKHFEFNPQKRYEIKSTIMQATIDENRGLFETSSADFFQMDLGSLTESPDPNQKSYIAGSLGLTLDRLHIERTHYSRWDIVAYAGGLAIALYVSIFVATFLWQKIERKMYIIKNIFYFAAKLENKVYSQSLNFQVKAELGSRYRITRASFWHLITCRGYRFFSQIKQGHKKLRMRMDIAKFLEEQKFCKIALSGLLTPAQLMFCEKEAKQIVRHGNFKSSYSSDEDRFNSDDSVMGGNQQVGVTARTNDNFKYVDAMTNRLNETDLRLLRASINEKEKPQKGTGDNEGGSIPESYTNEQHMTNQDFEKKVKFSKSASRPSQEPRDLGVRGRNITNISKKSIVEETSSINSKSQNRGKLKDAISVQEASSNLRQSQEAVETKAPEAAEDEQYVYRGPANKTGIFKNSLVLKDLTGFVEQPEDLTRDRHNETIDAGTQTIVHEEPTVVSKEKEGPLLNFSAEKQRGVYTHVGTPRRQGEHGLDHSTKRNSVEGKNMIRDSSLDRLDNEAQSLQGFADPSNQQQHINITNQITKQYVINRDANNSTAVPPEQEKGPTTADLQAQILRELQQANNLAKNTHQNVKKIAKSAKPNYLTNSEIDKMEDEVSNQGIELGSNARDGGESRQGMDYLTQGRGSAQGRSGLESGLSGRGGGVGNQSKSRRSPSPSKKATAQGSVHGHHGAAAEREPCKRCIEHAKRQRQNALKAKKLKSQANYMSINFDELEAQLRQEGHDCDEFVLNKMHPGDINFRDKRLTKMLGVYNEEVSAQDGSALGGVGERTENN